MPDIDPALSLSARLVLVLLLGAGVVHKARDLAGFALTIGQYRLLPQRGSGLFALAFTAAEALVVLSLLLNVAHAGWFAFVLLAIYTLAIAINLARGRRDIDCGCAGPAVRQTLDGSLIARNLALMGVALLAGLPTVERALTALDYTVVLAAATALALLYASANRLSSNAQRFARE